MSIESPTAGSSAPSASEYRFSWNRREFIRLHRAVTRNRRQSFWERLLIWGFLSFVVLSVGLTVFQFVRGQTGSAIGMLPWLMIMLFWVALFRWGNPWIAARTQEKHLRGPDAWLSFAIDESGITSTSTQGASSLKWSAVERVIASGEFLLFYFTRNCAYYLPRRAVPLDSEWATLTSRIAMYAPSGVATEPDRRRRRPVAAGVAGLAVLAFFAILGWAPPAIVVPGSELRPSYLRILQEEELLQPEEEVIYFYSGATWSIRSDINLLTSRGVVSYAQNRSGVYRHIVPYENILRVQLFRGDPQSTIEVTTTAGREVILYASSLDNGDQVFVDRLKQEWRDRVPFGTERLEPGASVDPNEGVVG